MRWVNQDAVPHGKYFPTTISSRTSVPALNNGTNASRPGESFEYAFTNPVRYGFHGEPGPWLRGLVEVFLELCKEPYVNISIEELKSSYKVGEPVAFKVVTAKRYGKAAAIDLLSQLKTRTPLRISAI
jgi:hypothetical protein